MLEWLRTIRAETRDGSALLAMFARLCPVPTAWSDNLKRVLLDWAEETGGSPQPVAAIEEYLYETLAEQNRAKTMHNGLFLATAHAVKGLEFDHVFVLGDSWREGAGAAMEDERRLYYVAMSRARETLHLFSLAASTNPHTRSLAGEFLIRRTPGPTGSRVTEARSYHLLGMDDLFIDFAGMKPEQHPARHALESLWSGHTVRIAPRNSQLELIDDHGRAIARLSKKAQAHWQGRLATIREIRVVAMVRRYRDDVTEQEYRSRCHGERWEVPIVELVI